MKKFVFYQLPLLIWAFIIFWISSLSTLPHIKAPFSTDKIAHASIFFVFCWFSRRALFFQNVSSFLKKWSLGIACLLTCLYGYFDEVHQLYVPGRMYDYFDMLADAVGALIFVILFIIVDRRNRRKTGTG